MAERSEGVRRPLLIALLAFAGAALGIIAAKAGGNSLLGPAIPAAAVAFALGAWDPALGFGALATGTMLGNGTGIGAAAGLVCALLASGSGAIRISRPGRRILLLAAALLGVAVLSWAANGTPGGSLAGWFVPYVPRLGLVVITAVAGRSERTAQALIAGLMVGATVQGLVGVAQHLGFIATHAETWLPGASAPVARVAGTDGDPNYYALELAIVAGAAASLWQAGRLRTLALATVALSVAGISLSLSRTGLLALITALAVVAGGSFLRSGRGSLRAILVVGAAAVLFAVSGAGLLLDRLAEVRTPSTREATTSTDQRLVLWSGAMGLIGSSPGLGVGPDQTRNHIAWSATGSLRTAQSAHSTPLDVAADLGLAGLVLWIGLVGTATAVVRAASRDTSRGRAVVARVCGAGLAAYLVGSLFITALFSAPAWVLLGILAALPTAEIRERAPAAARAGRQPLWRPGVAR